MFVQITEVGFYGIYHFGCRRAYKACPAVFYSAAAYLPIALGAVIFAAIVPAVVPACEADSLPDTEPIVTDEFVSPWNDGVYTAEADGYDGRISVTVTIEGGRIVSIEAESKESDQWFFELAKGGVIDAMIGTQSADVDAVANATYSSEGIKQAVRAALESAGRE